MKRGRGFGTRRRPEDMHVCLINMPIEYYSPVSGGAISTIMMHTARELLERGHRVSVLTPVNADPVYGIGKVIPPWMRRSATIFTFSSAAYRRCGSGWDGGTGRTLNITLVR